MNTSPVNGRLFFLAAICAWFFIGAAPSQAQTGARASEEIRIKALQGTAEISPAGAATWVFTTTGQLLHPGDRLRIGPNSRATLLWSDQSAVTLDPLAEIEILPPHVPDAQPGLNLFRGILSFFHRDKPGRIRAITRSGTAGVDGTEFVIAVESINNIERTTVYVIDGKVSLSNALGFRGLTNLQSAMAEPGTAPQPAPGFNVNNILQWCFYYPAVLDLRDLPLTLEEGQLLRESLIAYRSGDLLSALKKYPEARKPTSDAERIYYAALLLSVGQVTQAETILASLTQGASDQITRLAAALRQLIAAVRRDPNAPNRKSQIANLSLSTELLASSYYEQSRALGDATLNHALRLARQSSTNSPEFGFAWARVAELEFSFGHTSRAVEALDKSLALTPRNAEALALKGFLLAAQNKTREAIEWFTRAIAVDAALGNAWLGRGLCRIRRGDRTGGHEDLLIAAALEPQRSLLRSYLGKAYSDSADTKRASHELDLAKLLDKNDPTPWLYAALEHRLENEINPAINDLEKSMELNDNRSVYRSRLRLDEDRAVRSSSLANLYQSADLNDVALREAARAVSADYANYSAHLFLSDSFNALRDPTRFNLRYETAWFNELLLANLLSPVGGTPLSQHISQQEYSRLFERNRAGLSSESSYRSDGQYRERASQFGAIGNTGWSLDLDYQHNDGIRPNNELDRIEWYSTIKQQLTPQDSILFLTKYQDYHSGDNFQYYSLTNQQVTRQVFCLVNQGAGTTSLVTNLSTNSVRGFRSDFQFDEVQSPSLVAAYHREWTPNMHTLLLGGRLVNDQHISDRKVPLFVTNTNACGLFLTGEDFDVRYRSEFEIYTAELNQIAQTERHTSILGGRFQTGDFRTQNSITNADFPAFFPAIDKEVKDNFRRISVYGYHTWAVWDAFLLTAGLSYDQVTFPENHRQVPIQAGSSTRERFNPKAALVWSPAPEVTVRGVYTRSLGGVSFDESYRLEPAQLAGFSQSFRTLLSESVAGSVSAPAYETFGAAIDLKFKTRTYVGFQGEIAKEGIKRTVGIFDANSSPAVTSSTPEELNYTEHSAAVTLNQLISDQWSLGTRYGFTRSRLHTAFPALANAVNTPTVSLEHADLHQLDLYAMFNHPSGFFARAESQWYWQHNSGYDPALPGDQFVQVNLFVGYRFPRQRGELSLGLLNVAGQDYKLNPLNPYAELPRERVIATQLRFRF